MTQVLSHQIGWLTTGGKEDSTASMEHRPLPRSQRRPQRLEPGATEVKRSVRFAGSGSGAATALEEVGSAARMEKAGPPASTVAPDAAPTGDSEPSMVRAARPAAAPFTPRASAKSVEAFEISLPSPGWWVAAAGMALVAGALGWFGHELLRQDHPVSPARLSTPNEAKPTPMVAAGPARPDLEISPRATEALRLFNLALRAEKKGQPAQAIELLQQAQTAWPALPGVTYRMALLLLQRGDIPQSRALLEQSLAAGEQLSDARNLRSAYLRAEGRNEDGFAELEAATRAEPLNPKSFYYWAEALRRIGRMEEAAERLQDALARTNDPLETDFYSLKLRLVRIDQDREGEFADELIAKLKRPETAPNEWLLTAASVLCKRGDYATAAMHLGRVKERLSPAAADFLLSDQSFATQAWRKEMASLYSAPRPASAAPAAAAAK